ncbi:MAG: hypothetical protein FWH48_11345, partial [Oscillospiraceae bacterium]|nr:hypothetical protein [Oscillospiraceae bacterium]
GAGDTFFTSFVAAYFGLLDFAAIPRQTRCVCHPLSKGGLDAEQSLAFAVAAASAKVEKPGTEFATMQEIAVMHEKIKI